MQSWYVARTGPLQEYKVRDRLTAAGSEVFLPCVTGERPRRGHDDAPLFPGYLFIRSGSDADAAVLLQGLTARAHLVTFDGVAPKVPGEVIDDLRERIVWLEAEGGLWHRFQTGDRVSVAIGDAEAIGHVIQPNLSPRDRVGLLVEFLGGLVKVTVPSGRVQAGRPSRRTRGRGRFIRQPDPEL